MCSAHSAGTPAGTLRNRSKSSHECRWRTGTPRRRSSSATKCGVMNSRRLPRWIGPLGEAPEATVTRLPSPAWRTASSAARVTQSTGSPLLFCPPRAMPKGYRWRSGGCRAPTDASGAGASGGVGAVPRGGSDAGAPRSGPSRTPPRATRRRQYGAGRCLPRGSQVPLALNCHACPPTRPPSSQHSGSTDAPSSSTSGSSRCRATRSREWPSWCRASPTSCCATSLPCSSAGWWSSTDERLVVPPLADALSELVLREARSAAASATKLAELSSGGAAPGGGRHEARPAAPHRRPSARRGAQLGRQPAGAPRS